METATTDTPKKEAKSKYFYTDPDYDLNPVEANDVHVLIAREVNLGKVGNRTQIETQEITQIVDPQMWLICRKNWGAQGWIFVKMLHVPTELPFGFDGQEIVNN